MAIKAIREITLTKVSDIQETKLWFKQVNTGASAPAAPTVLNPASSTGWTTTEPPLNTAKDLYATMQTIYSDATSSTGFTYSTPHKYSSYEAAKEAYNLADTALGRAIEIGTTPPTDTSKIWMDTTVGKLKQYVDNGAGQEGTWNVINDWDAAITPLNNFMSNWSDLVDGKIDNLKLDWDTMSDTIKGTVFQQLSDEIIMNFYSKSEVTGLIGAAESRISQAQQQYIRFQDGTISLGDMAEDYTLKIENDKIGIYYQDQLISTWDQRTFQVSEIQFKLDDWPYKFAFQARQNGSLGFRKVSD